MEISTRRPRRGRLRRLLVASSVLCALALALVLLGPAALGLHRYAVPAGAPVGTYGAGSVFFTDDVRTEDLRVGDVIAHVPRTGATGHDPVTHRIATVDEVGRIRTRPDAEGRAAVWTFREGSATQPKVVFGLPHVGWVLVALAEPAVRVCLVLLLAASVAVRRGVRTIRSRRRQDEPLGAPAPDRDRVLARL